MMAKEKRISAGSAGGSDRSSGRSNGDRKRWWVFWNSPVRIGVVALVVLVLAAGAKLLYVRLNMPRDGYVNVFKVDGEKESMTIWADQKTNLPVRVEILNHAEGTTTTLNNFDWNPDLPESLFSLEPPPGYTVEDFTGVRETDLVEALRLCADLVGGAFPAAFDKDTPDRLIDTYLEKAGLLETTDTDNGQTRKEAASVAVLVETARRIGRRGFRFVRSRMFLEDDDWRYCGRGVKSGESDKPVCWWRESPMSAKCRVVYGDLSVKDVNLRDLPIAAKAGSDTTTSKRSSAAGTVGQSSVDSRGE